MIAHILTQNVIDRLLRTLSLRFDFQFPADPSPIGHPLKQAQHIRLQQLGNRILMNPFW